MGGRRIGSQTITIRLPLLVRVLQAVRLFVYKLFQSVRSPLPPPRGAEFPHINAVGRRWSPLVSTNRHWPLVGVLLAMCF